MSTSCRLVRELAAPMSRRYALTALAVPRRAAASGMLAPCAAQLAHRHGALLSGASRCCSTSAAQEFSPKINELVDQISSLTLLEASELTDALKARAPTLSHTISCCVRTAPS